MSTRTKSGGKRSVGRRLVATAVTAGAVAVALAPRDAGAQVAAGWAVNRYEPTPGGDAFFASDYPVYSGSRSVAVRFGLTADYAYRPLVLRPAMGEPRVVIENALAMHVQATVAALNRFDIGLSLPVGLLASGPAAQAGVPVHALNAVAVGDLRLTARVRLFGDAAHDAVSLHLGAQLFGGFLGYSQRSANVTDESARGRFYLAGAGAAGWLRWSATLGFQARPGVTIDTSGDTIGSDFFVTAAVAASLANDRVLVGPEFWMATVLDRAFSNTSTGAEIVLAGHFLVANTVLLGLGVGPGLTRGAGSPAVRGLFTLAYAPADRAPTALPGDTDMDGVLDTDDLCVTEPMGAHPDPARRGCPARDTDHDGVFDNEDQCVETPQGDRPDPARLGCPMPDTDHDGVMDPDDQCVTVPQGEHPDPTRRGCPDLDTDGDTVLDSRDQCPHEHQGYNPDPTRVGCPTPDRDHDSVPDPQDHCPDQPGAPSPDPMRNGCPGLVNISGGMLRITRPVFFATNRDVILPRSNAVLQAVADTLQAVPLIHRVSIEGHTDDVGTDEHNDDLSSRRAASVMRWLVAHGVDAGRLEAHGYGEQRPMRPIDGLHGPALNAARAENRRVEFRITDPATGSGVSNSTSSAPPARPLPPTAARPARGPRGA